MPLSLLGFSRTFLHMQWSCTVLSSLLSSAAFALALSEQVNCVNIYAVSSTVVLFA